MSSLLPHMVRYAGVTAETIASEKKLLDANREDFTKNKKEFKRIFIKDADRTFRTTANRVTLMHVLVSTRTCA